MDDKLDQILTALTSLTGEHNGRGKRQPLMVRTGAFEWIKLLLLFIGQTGTIVFFGTRAYDAHDARIAAVESRTADSQANHDILIELKAAAKSWDSRLERIEAKQK